MHKKSAEIAPAEPDANVPFESFEIEPTKPAERDPGESQQPQPNGNRSVEIASAESSADETEAVQRGSNETGKQ
jgi:hypothetical protein